MRVWNSRKEVSESANKKTTKPFTKGNNVPLTKRQEQSKKMQRSFYLSGTLREVRNFIRPCDDCQQNDCRQNNPKHRESPADGQTIRKGDTIFERIYGTTWIMAEET